LFGVYYRAALYEDAVRIAERASTYDDPHGIDARYNAALALTRLGRYEEALAKLRTSRPSRKTPGDVAFQIAVVKVAMAKFAQARLILDELVKEKYAEASTLRAFLPALEGAAHELAVLPDTAPPEHRARLVSMLGRHVEAARAWSEVVRSPSASEALLAEALLYLVQSGDRGAIEAASQALTRKQGKLSPELAAMVELRLDELERLVRARERWSAHIVAP
ncbi:MAG TPA: hypothetical protein VGK73_00350, partial [Polyangiaceae bacterium]